MNDTPAYTGDKAEAGVGDETEQESIWRNRDFRAFLVGQGVSNLGDAVTATALPLLVLSLTHSGAQMGAVASVEAAASFLFGPIAGALADRWNRRRILFAASLGLALVTALIPLAVWTHLPVLLVVYLVAAPVSVLGALFSAAYTAALPRLVGRDALDQANSFFEALESLAWIIGPGVAGILVGRIGAGPTLLVDAGSFLVAAAAITRIRRSLQAAERPEPEHIWREMRAGLSYIARHASLRALLLFWWTNRVLSAPLIVAITYYVTVDRHLGQSVVGLVISAYAAGSVVGTLLAGRAGARRAEGRTLFANAGMGAAAILLALAGVVPFMLVAAFLFGLGEGFVLVVYLSARARATPDALLGRVGGTAATVGAGLTPLGLMGGGLLLDHASGAAVLSAMGIGTLVMSLLFALSRGLRGITAAP